MHHRLRKIDKRRELLDTKNLFYKKYPFTCIFLIEEVYADIDGDDFTFEFFQQHNQYSEMNDLQIRFWCKKERKIKQQYTPIDELEGWPFEHIEVDITEDEERLRKIYEGK